MKRFHVHVTVTDLAANVEFYSKLFGQPPAKERPDYAKWMLDDPRVNFAISTQHATAGLDHFGLQAETAQELAVLRTQADAAANGALRDEGSVACCYAQSDKHWTVDPQGIAWEHFMTTGELGTRHASTGCCVPLHGNAGADEACCVPADGAAATACCS
ncbi:MAG TPA: VOC family protein [Gammaproteobacteria bacterium]|nr:VOC family protein [Gammaproteobacteria bacterium]